MVHSPKLTWHVAGGLLKRKLICQPQCFACELSAIVGFREGRICQKCHPLNQQKVFFLSPSTRRLQSLKLTYHLKIGLPKKKPQKVFQSHPFSGASYLVSLEALTGWQVERLETDKLIARVGTNDQGWCLYSMRKIVANRGPRGLGFHRGYTQVSSNPFHN